MITTRFQVFVATELVWTGPVLHAGYIQSVMIQ